MNPEQKRLAIAEACGWIVKSKGSFTFVYPPNKTTGNGYQVNDIMHPKIIRLLPDYLNDLNAMHEAEKTLTPTQQNDYCFTIMDIQNSGGGFARLHATAAQRADAFISTLGLDKQTNTNQ
jgi:hypothetical protein